MSEFIQGVENGNDGKLVVPSWGKKGKWYKVTLEKEDGKYSVKDYDSELPTVTATDYGIDVATSKDGKDFHLISVASDPSGKESFMYPAVGKNITSDGVYAIDFNKPNTNVSLKINDTAATVSQTVNGLVQKNINLSASVESGGIQSASFSINKFDMTSFNTLMKTLHDEHHSVIAILAKILVSGNFLTYCAGLEVSDFLGLQNGDAFGFFTTFSFKTSSRYSVYHLTLYLLESETNSYTIAGSCEIASSTLTDNKISETTITTIEVSSETISLVLAGEILYK